MAPHTKDCQTHTRRTLSVLLAALMAVAALGFAAAPAMAQSTDPTDAQYSGSDEVIAAGVGDGDDPGSANGGATGSSVDGLPFTGLDVALASVVGALLLGTGLVMRRASRSPGASA